MELTRIRTGILGYNKSDICQYISEVNELHASELDAVSSEMAAVKEELGSKLEAAEKKNLEVQEKNTSLSEEIDRLTEELKNAVERNNELTERLDALEAESENYREKSAAISTAIINAEKCAGAVLDEANTKAEEMINRAVSKVEVQTKRLSAAKEYIAELRISVADTLRKLDAELADAERSIERKKSLVADKEYDKKSEEKAYSDSAANSARERFGIFRRA